MIYVVLYLVAIVAANLTVAAFGPSMVILNSFLFIGLDLVARDRLHDLWHGNRLFLKMALLVLSGSVLSWLLNQGAAQIALASFAAFMLAGIVDSLAYHALAGRSWVQRSNGSNILAAAVDSIVFPSIAFGALLPLIILGQFAAKVLGGLAWSIVIYRWQQRGAIAAGQGDPGAA